MVADTRIRNVSLKKLDCSLAIDFLDVTGTCVERPWEQQRKYAPEMNE